jgi:hypothetical protein
VRGVQSRAALQVGRVGAGGWGQRDGGGRQGESEGGVGGEEGGAPEETFAGAVVVRGGVGRVG